VQPFERTGLAPEHQESENYLWVKGKGGRVRWIPITSPEQQAALTFARTVVHSPASPMGNPARDLRGNLRRLDYALARFGLTRAALGVTAHGLRHQALNDAYEAQTGVPTPVRGGGTVAMDADRAARYKVSNLAGHARRRAAGAYIGSRPRQGWKPQLDAAPTQPAPGARESDDSS
jgi:integrase